jgi:hypothetical protein
MLAAFLVSRVAKMNSSFAKGVMVVCAGMLVYTMIVGPLVSRFLTTSTTSG